MSTQEFTREFKLLAGKFKNLPDGLIKFLKSCLKNSNPEFKKYVKTLEKNSNKFQNEETILINIIRENFSSTLDYYFLKNKEKDAENIKIQEIYHYFDNKTKKLIKKAIVTEYERARMMKVRDLFITNVKLSPLDRFIRVILGFEYFILYNKLYSDPEAVEVFVSMVYQEFKRYEKNNKSYQKIGNKKILGILEGYVEPDDLVIDSGSKAQFRISKKKVSK